MGALGLGLALAGGRPGHSAPVDVPAAPLLLSQPPNVSGSGVAATVLTVDASDIWHRADSPVDVTARSYRLIVNGSMVAGPQSGDRLTLPADAEGLSYLVQMQAQADGVWSAWIDIASGTVAAAPALGLTLLAEGEVMIENATGDITITVTAPEAYVGTYVVDTEMLSLGPVSLVPPRILSGTAPEVGDILTILPTLWLYDPGQGIPAMPSYLWQSRDGNDAFTDIGGATEPSLQLAAAQGGRDVRVTETLSDAGGSRTTASTSVGVAATTVVRVFVDWFDSYADADDIPAVNGDWNYHLRSGTAGFTYEAASAAGRLQPGASGTQRLVVTCRTDLQPDHYAEMIFENRSGSGQIIGGVCARVNGMDDRYSAVFDKNLGGVVLRKSVAGVVTDIAQVTHDPAQGDRLRLEMRGNDLTVLLDTGSGLTPVLTATDADIPGGKAGLEGFFFNSGTRYFRVSRFECGDL